MNFYLKPITIALCAATLTACGGSDGSNDNKNNTPPMLEDGAQAARVITLHETDAVFDDEANLGKTVDFIDIDLLEGVVDNDPTDVIRVTNLLRVWEGPDCSIPAVATTYWEECAELNGGDPTQSKPDDFIFPPSVDVKKAQNLPVVVDSILGFEIKQSSVRVTPTKFAPILLSGQTAQYNITYQVSDGKESIDRALTIIVEGEDHAPEFTEFSSDQLSASENSQPIVLDLFENVIDKDIDAAEEYTDQVGDLKAIYNKLYTPEVVKIENFTASDETLASAFRKINDENGKFTKLEIDPSKYADMLERLEKAKLTFNFEYTDGNNVVPRTIVFTVNGASETNPPEFNGNLAKSVLTTDEPLVVDLLEDAWDGDGDAISVINTQLTFNGDIVTDESSIYGVYIDKAKNQLTVDPYAFLSIPYDPTAPEEERKKTLVYTYDLSDGEFQSDDSRTLTIDITAQNPNILAGKNTDFEAALDDTNWQYQSSPSESASMIGVDSSEFNSGASALQIKENSVNVRFLSADFPQDTILDGETYYVNYWAKQPNHKWGKTSVQFIHNDDFKNSKISNILDSPNYGTVEWVEHTNNFKADDRVTGKKVGFTATLNTGTLDDFSLVKYDYFNIRELTKNGGFETGKLEPWVLVNGGTATVTETAKLNGQYGVLIDTTGRANNPVILRLDSTQFKQGAVEKDGRYFVEFDIRHVNYKAGDSPDGIGAQFYTDEAPKRVSRKAQFALQDNSTWSHMLMNLSPSSTSMDFEGATNTDINVDWAVTPTGFEILFKGANSQYYVDNIRVFRVPTVD